MQHSQSVSSQGQCSVSSMKTIVLLLCVAAAQASRHNYLYQYPLEAGVVPLMDARAVLYSNPARLSGAAVPYAYNQYIRAPVDAIEYSAPQIDISAVLEDEDEEDVEVPSSSFLTVRAGDYGYGYEAQGQGATLFYDPTTDLYLEVDDSIVSPFALKGFKKPAKKPKVPARKTNKKKKGSGLIHGAVSSGVNRFVEGAASTAGAAAAQAATNSLQGNHGNNDSEETEE